MDTSILDELEEKDNSVDHCCYIAQEDKNAYKTEKMNSLNSEKADLYLSYWPGFSLTIVSSVHCWYSSFSG